MIIPKLRRLAVTALAALAGTIPAPSAAQDLPAAPLPVVPSGPASADPPQPSQLPSPAQIPTTPGPLPGSPIPVVPAVPVGPALVPHQDNNGPLLREDPLLDRPHSSGPGWFWSVELNVVAPQIKNRLQAPVAINSPVVAQPGIQEFLPEVVHLPTAELDWTGAPRFELGYRCAEGLGEFLFSYRFVVSEGRALIPGFDFGDDGFLKSRLDLHAFDFDYGSPEWSLDPHWDMQWRLGARLANVFFDSLAEGFFREERTSDHFIGAGPHVGLDLWRKLDIDGLSLFLQLEGAAVVGQISQSFERVIGDDVLLGGATLVHHTQAVPVLNVQAGLGWTPWDGRTRFALGYEFERWWNVGDAAGAQAELTTQGIFFRAEVGF